MSFKYNADFGRKRLVGYGTFRTITRGMMEKDADLCHIFSVKKDELHLDQNIVKLVPGKTKKEQWLFGPASTKDKIFVFPCSCYRCLLPCPCTICAKLPHHKSCQNLDREQCSCDACIKSFGEHVKFHAAYHLDCKYCGQLLRIFPCFNFFFLNSLNEEKLTGWTVSMPKIKPISDGLGFSIDLEAMIERQRTRKFECHECESLFDTIDQLRDHLMKNHLTGERFIHHFADTVKTPHTDQVCETCETIFSSKKELIRHVRSVHYLQKVLCTQCGKQFSRKSDLARHNKIGHEVQGGQNYICGVCNTNFNRKDNLERHKEASLLTGGDAKCKCSDCVVFAAPEPVSLLAFQTTAARGLYDIKIQLYRL